MNRTSGTRPSNIRNRMFEGAKRIVKLWSFSGPGSLRDPTRENCLNRYIPESAGNFSTRLAILATGTLVVLLGAVLPRVAGLSSFPTTDEGFYAYYAMRMGDSIAQGHLPADGFLMIYPLVTSWAFDLPLNPIVTLRLIDLTVSAVAAALFFVMILREARSLPFAAVIALIFLLTMNWGGFVQNGYKNSIFFAYIPLFLALTLTQGVERPGTGRLLVVGALLAAAVLAREPFAGFAVLGVVAAWIHWGSRSAITVAAGGAMTAVAVVGILLIARGDANSLLSAYSSAGHMFDSLQDQRFSMFLGAAETWLRGSILAVFLAALSLLGLLAVGLRQNDRKLLGRTLFWTAAALVPLIEPALKIGFPYHFATALPGLAGLCALAWRLIPLRTASVLCTLSLVAACGYFFHQEVRWKSRMLPESVALALRTAKEGWPQDTHSSSNYLIAADLIKGASSEGQTLSVSGFMFPLFPLTDRLPPSAELADLTLALIELDMDQGRLLAAIQACPPDVIVTTTRTEWPGASMIEETVEKAGMYRWVGTVPVNPEASYGTFGGNVYAKVANSPSTCHR